jgi:hypothetical protein
MKCAGRLHIVEGFFVGVALTDHNRVDSHRVCHVAVPMFLDDDLDLLDMRYPSVLS